MSKFFYNSKTKLLKSRKKVSIEEKVELQNCKRAIKITTHNKIFDKGESLPFDK